MSSAKFIQIHSLHGYSSVLLNRDDSGLAKRIRYGGKVRTRISSQCLKRHWRIANGINSLHDIDGATAAARSREIVTRRVIDPLRSEFDSDLIKVLESEIQRAVYGQKGESASSRQPLLLGEPEIEYLSEEARKLAESHSGQIKETEKVIKEWGKHSKKNMEQLRNSCKLPAGLISALFGRMVTSDPNANIDAAIHVAHSFTVHAEESESDYFTVVDDLQRVDEDSGADHIGETELTSGIFYGYVVIDRQMLISNLGGDVEMASEVIKRLVHLIATVSPGAKLGSTAPYGYASWLLIEAGERQPRSLAESFRMPCEAQMANAESVLNKYIEKYDSNYGSHEKRGIMSINSSPVQGASQLHLEGLASWAAAVVGSGAC